MSNYGFIQLHRKFLKWEWYDDANTMRLFLHCLLNANYIDKNWRGIIIPRGSFLTGRLKLAQALNLTERQIRTSLKKLKSTNEVTIKSTSQYSIITVVNWDCYQKNDQQNDQRVTSKRPTSDQQVTTTNKDNKGINKEEETATEILINWYGSEFRNVYLTEKEYNKLLGIIMHKETLDKLIDEFSRKIAAGKEPKWTPECPHAHYVRLEDYWQYRRKFPDKFKTVNEETKELDGWTL